MSKIIEETELGWFGVSGSGKGVTAIILPRKTAKEASELLPGEDDSNEAVPADLEDLAARLRKYFEGEDVEFPDKLDYKGATELQRKVWEETRRIPYGETRTYGWIAKKINCRSARAVGQALGKNPFPIVIPCHRVIGSDGKLVGFGCGLELKEQLLRMENAI